VLALDAGDGEHLKDPDGFLREIGVTPDTDNKELPDFLR